MVPVFISLVYLVIRLSPKTLAKKVSFQCQRLNDYLVDTYFFDSNSKIKNEGNAAFFSNQKLITVKFRFIDMLWR